MVELKIQPSDLMEVLPDSHCRTLRQELVTCINKAIDRWRQETHEVDKVAWARSKPGRYDY